jgi:hypothetical protein
MNRAHALLLAASFIVCGCSTAPMPFEQSHSPWASRVHAPEMVILSGSAPAPGMAAVRVSRDAATLPTRCLFDLFLDNKPVVSVTSGDGIELQVSPGRHSMRLESGGIVCDAFEREVSFDVGAGKVATIRTGLADARPYIAVVGAD